MLMLIGVVILKLNSISPIQDIAFFKDKSILTVSDYTNEGIPLRFHLCKVDPKKGIIKGEDNFYNYQKVYAICAMTPKELGRNKNPTG